ncbi:MAG: 2'-5' RNA ligase family protein [Mycobacteriales bacterium]
MKSAIILALPEAEALVGALRQEGDPSAALGIPAHVTLLYPFVPDPDVGVVAELEFFFERVDGFALTFSKVGEFPEVVYLDPDEAHECAALTKALALRWPDCPPYGGEFDEVVPHLTVVDTPDATLRSWARAHVEAGLPLRALAREASLWVQDERTRHWTQRAVFPLAPHA